MGELLEERSQFRPEPEFKRFWALKSHKVHIAGIKFVNFFSQIYNAMNCQGTRQNKGRLLAYWGHGPKSASAYGRHLKWPE